ncbi:hypothetical protein CMQ_723 [Grosmannia clavigera kw1407]|uniref:Uncharacterized protein n=1 Tax=Grosmannia clavigera (strain kw1407 / UAMH 11150) TaxID=655863 RepID=F0XCB6_GROCL|nr:uncharacterized protein CMQ_723 [Grosmannia clavigera kw1407]EFX03795.1 hypothetical protein CMQ_723 [Grosmannia clavigera kw1407]
MEARTSVPPQTPIDLLCSLDDTRRRVYFFCLGRHPGLVASPACGTHADHEHEAEYAVDSAIRGRGVPSAETFGQLTGQTNITSSVTQFVQGLEGGTVLRDAFAAVETLKPLFLSLPPGQATSHRVSTAATGARMSDRPLGGATMRDGRSDTWERRLADKGTSYYSGSGPLIGNQYEARELRAEYASLNFKEVTGDRHEASPQFPQAIEEQRKLVGQLYDAIKSMDNILEKKRPISLKKRKQGGEGEGGGNSNGESVDRNENGNDQNEEEDDDQVAGQQLGRPQIKESVSVRKVKGLSRIEVEMLCWDLLFTVRDIHRGRLPFQPWSRNDWCWEGSFVSFGQRFDAVVETLRQSKAAVCSLLESDKMARLAAHPRREYKRKENNRSQNAERNAQVFVGRHAIETQQVQVNRQTGDLQDRDGNVVAAAAHDCSGLIEQTRRLADPSRREAKRVRFLASIAESGEGAEEETGRGRTESADGIDSLAGRTERLLAAPPAANSTQLQAAWLADSETKPLVGNLAAAAQTTPDNHLADILKVEEPVGRQTHVQHPLPADAGFPLWLQTACVDAPGFFGGHVAQLLDQPYIFGTDTNTSTTAPPAPGEDGLASQGEDPHQKQQQQNLVHVTDTAVDAETEPWHDLHQLQTLGYGVDLELMPQQPLGPALAATVAADTSFELELDPGYLGLTDTELAAIADYSDATGALEDIGHFLRWSSPTDAEDGEYKAN